MPQKRKRRAVCVFVVCALAACAEQRISGPPPSQSTASLAAPTAEADAAAVQTKVESPPQQQPETLQNWVDAVRFERWADAALMIDALAETERQRPEIKYARARVALALHDFGKAVELLNGLESQLPLLAPDVVRYRAEAALEAGPYEEAAAYYATSKNGVDLARVAKAYANASDLVKARFFANRAVAAMQRSKKKTDEVFVRLTRANIHLTEPLSSSALTIAAVDLRWIAQNAPSCPEAKTALELLQKHNLPSPVQNRLTNIQEMIASGDAAQALVELDKLDGNSSFPVAELQHQRAVALYKTRDYEGAAKAFLLAASTTTTRQPEQLHFAARAFSRINQDDDAITRHLEVVNKFGKTSWAEKSSFFAARLLMQVGRYKEAVAQYNQFLKAYPRSDRQEDAEYERALAMLSSGDAQLSQQHLSRLAKKARVDQASRLHELQGLAMLRAGDQQGAVAQWTSVMKSEPLSFAALMARSRLASLNVALPPLLEPSIAYSLPPLEVKLPAVAQLLVSIGLDADAEAWLSANERTAAASYGGRDGEALCAMYGMLTNAKRRYRVGASVVSYEALKRAPSTTTRWAWECVYPQPYLPPIRELETRYDLPKDLMFALMRQESAFDPGAVSFASAVGLMQLIPNTARNAAKEMDLELELTQLTSPTINLRLGGFYIGKLLKLFENSLPVAVAAYNAGPKAVSHWLEVNADKDTDLWIARIPYDETRHYVGRVLGNLARYQWLDGGDHAVSMIPLEIPTGIKAPKDAY